MSLSLLTITTLTVLATLAINRLVTLNRLERSRRSARSSSARRRHPLPRRTRAAAPVPSPPSQRQPALNRPPRPPLPRSPCSSPPPPPAARGEHVRPRRGAAGAGASTDMELGSVGLPVGGASACSRPLTRGWPRARRRRPARGAHALTWRYGYPKVLEVPQVFFCANVR